MKIITLALIIFSCITVLGQSKNKKSPIILRGQITGCAEKYLTISFQAKNGETLIDTIHLDSSGKFYLKTFKLTIPQKTSIQQNNIQIRDLFVAPGYNLTITGNGKDFLSLLRTTKIDGKGAESNRYRSILNSVLISRMDTTKWFELNEKDFLSYINNQQKLEDSIAHIVFDRNTVQDKYLKYFGNLVQLDNRFNRLCMLCSYSNQYNYSYEKSVSFVRNNFDNKTLDSLYQDEYLLSEKYKNSLIVNDWLTYLVNLDYKKDSALRSQEDYKFKKVNELYKGNVKEYALYKLMRSSIEYCSSFEKLNGCKERFEPYMINLKDEYYKRNIEFKYINKEAELLRTQIGKQAPTFILRDNIGNLYRLEDFKGKVVYLDLWASWCGPCRAEMPSFKLLYDKYKNDNRISFISIAVHDGVNEWKNALEEDQPKWLQLLDQDGTVSKSYVANVIPKFVLIDKSGNIVKFDAPRPSDSEELAKVLDIEIAK